MLTVFYRRRVRIGYHLDDSKLQVLRSDIEKIGEGCANLLELSGLSMALAYTITWKADGIDLTELARKRWVDKWSMAKIARHFGIGRTATIRWIGKIRSNPALVDDGGVRSRIHHRKYRFMGLVL